MFGLGGGEILIIFVIALIFIGPKKIPELAKGLGQAIKEFQRAKDDMFSEVKKEVENAAAPKKTESLAQNTPPNEPEAKKDPEQNGPA